MSLRDLVDGECGGANQLMRMGAQLTRDNARKDEGFAGVSETERFRGLPGAVANDDFVNEFLAQAGRSGPAPQTFRMDSLVKEMQGISQQLPPGAHAQTLDMWRNDFMNQQRDLFEGPSTSHQSMGPQVALARPGPSSVDTMNWTREFFDEKQAHPSDIPLAARGVQRHFPTAPDAFQYSEFANFVNQVADEKTTIANGQVAQQEDSSWATQFNSPESWLEDFQKEAQKQTADNEKYNQEFWNRLQEEWKKISEENDEGHPWLSDFTNYYDPYKEYTFDENTPTEAIENAFEKGKQFLAQGDIPSAVYCFESAVKQHPENPEYWEYLGTSQAENEKDPNAIAALKKSLELQPNNGKVMMALAVSFTNESLQNQALKMLMSWLKSHPVYGPLVPSMATDEPSSSSSEMPSSLIRGPDLVEVQNLLLKAVHASSPNVDAELQEALGVLFNLSSEYDKAVDCFQAAAMAQPGNAKIWNRLGASLANGHRSTEAVEAYQRALEIHPGFIRARYNVGIICINLKAYREAVEHFLTALNHQASSKNRSGIVGVDAGANQMSDTIWSTLRMAISLMGKHDLQVAIDNRDLAALNRAFEVPTTATTGI